MASMASNISLKIKVLNVLFATYRTLVLPWKRTPANWVAIIFNGAGSFASLSGSKQGLPSGEVDGDKAISSQCLTAMGLHKWSFSDRAPFALIHIDGRGGSGMTFYFSGELVADEQAAKQFDAQALYLPRYLLGNFLPSEVEQKLSHGS
jgi:hypothetical protein